MWNEDVLPEIVADSPGSCAMPLFSLEMCIGDLRKLVSLGRASLFQESRKRG